jgi:hypothetical protein
MRWSVAVSMSIALTAAGCGSRCAEVLARKRALTERTAIAAGPHAQVQIPLARANALLAAIVHERPLRAPIELPRLGPFTLPVRELTATARDVELRPAPADRLRFAIRVELADPQQPITTLAVIAEVVPQLSRTASASELVIGFGPENLVSVKPELGPDAGRALVDAVARWIPAAVRDHIPRAVLDQAARQLAEYLTGEAYTVLRSTLLHRLGELTRLGIRLPALPIAGTAIASSPDAVTVDLTTDLPVRRGLTSNALRSSRSNDIVVRISESTTAELANWSIDHGYLPQRYTRDLEPRPDGDHRPYFDYITEDRQRPVKIHVFGDRGSCEYFQVGLRLQLAIAGDALDVTALDRLVEVADASAPIELALWLKQLVQGAVDRSYRAAAHTRLSAGGRAFETRVIGAAVNEDELDFALEVTPEPGAPPLIVPSSAQAMGDRT